MVTASQPRRLAIAAPGRKHALIAALNERLAAAPAALPQAFAWSMLTPARDEFRRVRFTATYANLPDAMVYSAGSAVRDDVSGPGTWAFLPARLPTATPSRSMPASCRTPCRTAPSRTARSAGSSPASR